MVPKVHANSCHHLPFPLQVVLLCDSSCRFLGVLVLVLHEEQIWRGLVLFSCFMGKVWGFFSFCLIYLIANRKSIYLLSMVVCNASNRNNLSAWMSQVTHIHASVVLSNLGFSKVPEQKDTFSLKCHGTFYLQTCNRIIKGTMIPIISSLNLFCLLQKIIVHRKCRLKNNNPQFHHEDIISVYYFGEMLT